jgi:hypothetical protein
VVLFKCMMRVVHIITFICCFCSLFVCGNMQLVRHRLLRCYLDRADGLRARQLLDEMLAIAPAQTQQVKDKGKNKGKATETAVSVPQQQQVVLVADKRSCCVYNRAFIEHISLLIEEPDASESVRDEWLGKGTNRAKLFLIEFFCCI